MHEVEVPVLEELGEVATRPVAKVGGLVRLGVTANDVSEASKVPVLSLHAGSTYVVAGKVGTATTASDAALFGYAHAFPTGLLAEAVSAKRKGGRHLQRLVAKKEGGIAGRSRKVVYLGDGGELYSCDWRCEQPPT